MKFTVEAYLALTPLPLFLAKIQQLPRAGHPKFLDKLDPQAQEFLDLYLLILEFLDLEPPQVGQNYLNKVQIPRDQFSDRCQQTPLVLDLHLK